MSDAGTGQVPGLNAYQRGLRDGLAEAEQLLAMLKRVTEEYEATQYFEPETIKMAKALIAAKEK